MSLPSCLASVSDWQETDVSTVLDVQSSETKFGIEINTPDKESKQQNVSFADQNAAYSYEVSSTPDPTFGQADLEDVKLNDFFLRPIKIASFEWGVGNILFERFNPWQLYFENPRIINRIANFALLRAKLHVKILINGNGFHYGRAICSYIPLHTDDDFTLDRAFFSQDIVQASQRPHIYLDPTTSQGGEMKLPFFWFKNALAIPQNEWVRMGELTLQSFQALKHANGATDRVTVSVFAWAEEVTLSMPTASDPGALVPQCDEQQLDTQADEYGTGIISKPASLVERWAGMLSTAPVIGMYARATELAAGAVKNIANIWGYSRPAVLNDIVPFRPTYVGNLANTNMPDSTNRLTLDAKQEVTIDPRVVGLGDTDEMAIVPLAMRESYVTSFPWTVSASTEDLLWNSEVTPMMWAENPISNPPEIHMTPSCWVTMPFKNWRGSMEFRFQIVCSQYHKGRLKVVWDPYFPATNEYVTNYTWILDLAEEKDFTVKVGWGSQYGYCVKDTPGLSSPPYSTNKLPINPAATANGQLSVYVVNELTIPNSTINNDISINVFTKMCDDYEVANPSSNQVERYVYFLPPQTEAEKQALIEEAGYPYGVAALTRRVSEANRQRYERILNNEDTDETLTQAQRQQYINERLAAEGFAVDNEVEEELLDLQSSEEIVQGDVEDTTEPSKPMSMEVDGVLGKEEMDTTDHALDVFFGEQVVSIRQLLKRYQHHTTFGSTSNGPNLYKRRSNNLPYHRGYAPGGVHSAGGVPYNRCRTTMLGWYLPAFTAWRGATRWKYVRGKEIIVGAASGEPTFLTKAYMSVRRLATEAFGYSETEDGIQMNASANFVSWTAMENMGNTWDGNTVTETSVNPVLEVELPYYSNLRFGFAKEANLTTSTSVDYFHELETFVFNNTSSASQFDSYCSIGEDFSLYFFTGAPIAYYQGFQDPLPV